MLQVFTDEEAASLERYIIKCSAMFHGLGYEATRKLAFDYATKLQKVVPPSWSVNHIAGADWMYMVS